MLSLVERSALFCLSHSSLLIVEGLGVCNPKELIFFDSFQLLQVGTGKVVVGAAGGFENPSVKVSPAPLADLIADVKPKGVGFFREEVFHVRILCLKALRVKRKSANVREVFQRSETFDIQEVTKDLGCWLCKPLCFKGMRGYPRVARKKIVREKKSSKEAKKRLIILPPKGESFCKVRTFRDCAFRSDNQRER